MLINARLFIARIFMSTLYFVQDAAYWVMDMSVGVWTTLFDLFSAALNRASKWVKRPTLTMVFEDRWMRVLVVHRKRVIAWDTFSRPTPFSAPAANVESQNNWLAHRLKEFLKSNRLGRMTVVTSVPLRSSLFREMRLPSIDQQYLGDVIASEMEETIPFAKEDVDIAWHFRDPEESNAASAVAVPKTVTDESVALVNEANVELNAIFSEAEAMAYAAGDDDALVVRLVDRHASMALVMDGTPQLLHRIQYDPASIDQPEQFSALVVSLEQLASNSGRANRGAARMKSLNVILMGADGDIAPLRRSLASQFHCDAQPNAPDIELPEAFPRAEYALNLGLAVAWDSKIKRGIFKRVEVGLNLLQERHIPRRMPIKSGAAVAILFVLIGLAVTATFEVRDVEAAETALSSRASSIERQFRLRWGQANKIQQDAESVRIVNKQLDGVLTQLRTETEALLNRVSAIIELANDRGMSVPKLSPEGREFVVAGTALSFDVVFDYAADLRKTGLFEDVLVLRLDAIEINSAILPNDVVPVLFQVKVLIFTEGSILQDDDLTTGSKIK